MNSRSAVAIILALAVAMTMVLSSEVAHYLAGIPAEYSYQVPEGTVAALENILFAIVGALAGYIVGKDSI